MVIEWKVVVLTAVVTVRSLSVSSEDPQVCCTCNGTFPSVWSKAGLINKAIGRLIPFRSKHVPVRVVEGGANLVYVFGGDPLHAFLCGSNNESNR